jgi:hypothetical protein
MNFNTDAIKFIVNPRKTKNNWRQDCACLQLFNIQEIDSYKERI